jgi:SRSO17 transposase
VKHALGNGIQFDWLVFDEGYGKDPAFLFELDALGRTWIGEVPKNFRCWPIRPKKLSQNLVFSRYPSVDQTRSHGWPDTNTR